MKMLGKAAFIFGAILPSPNAIAQVPPPPPLPQQAKISEDLVRVFADKDLNGYSTLLADDLKVYEDDVLIAESKAEWLKRFGPMLGAKGVSFTLSHGFASTGRILFTEYYNTVASWGGSVPAHCCWGYDAVAYDIAGGKIKSIRRLKGGDMRLDETGKRATP